MDLLGESIKCTTCKKILKKPVSLPCGHSICERHAKKTAEENMTDEIYCPECNEFFDIPINGFPKNRALESLLEKNIAKIDLGEEYKSASEKCSLFGDLLDRFYKIKNDPEFIINEEISELRNDVDLKREEMKQEIDEEAMKLMEKLDEFEKECKLKAASLKSDSSLDEKLDYWENSLEQWQQSLNSFERNVDNWNRVLNESTSILKDLHKEFINFNRELFLNRLIEFKYPDSSEFITITYEVKELSKYTNTIETIELKSSSVIIDEVEWKIRVVVQSIENKNKNLLINKRDTYIGIYLHTYQKPRICNLKVNCDLVILDRFGTNKSCVRNIEKVYDTNIGWGNPKMISLKDLIADCNLYNAQSDSCTVQAIVKKFEWI